MRDMSNPDWGGDPVDSVARPAGNVTDRCFIPDLRGIPLGQLASLAANGEKSVTSLVSHIVDDEQGVLHIPAMMFNSAI